MVQGMAMMQPRNAIFYVDCGASNMLVGVRGVRCKLDCTASSISVKKLARMPVRCYGEAFQKRQSSLSVTFCSVSKGCRSKLRRSLISNVVTVPNCSSNGMF